MMMRANLGQRALIAISGVDGSGKSTVIEALRAGPHALPAAVRVLDWGRTQARSPGGPILNHARPPRAPWLSVLKLAVRGAQWWWTYYRTCRPWINQGGVILCDRFYFDDVLLDPLKYRYGGPLWLARQLRAWLPQPGVYILLDAPVAVLAARKQEVTVAEIGRLQAAYVALLRDYPCAYRVEAAAPLEAVVAEVRQLILGL